MKQLCFGINIASTLVSVSLMILLAFGLTCAQFPAGYGWVMPRESPAASISQTVGVTEITIKYHRPAAKGRTIWGCQSDDFVPKPKDYPCLVPNGQVWRAGANDATRITFSTDVIIEGQPLRAGTYGLFMVPSDKEWTIIFSKNSRQWGAFAYKEADDALRVKVMAQPVAELQERLEYSFPVGTDDATQIALRWEKLRLAFNLNVDTPRHTSA